MLRLPTFSLPLTQRLTLFFTVVSASVVLGLGVLFLVATEQHFVDLDHAILQDKQHLVEDILSAANSADDARWRLSEALNHHQGLHVRVQDAVSVLFQSPSPWQQDEHALRSWQFEQRPAFANGQAIQVMLAIDTGHHNHFLSDLKRSLVLYAVLATLVSGVLGWLAAHQGLAPLRAIRSRAAGVSAQQLDERMPVDAVPEEMADLAHELNRMLERLQHDFKQLSDFSSDLAHELRTPISNLLTQTQVTLSAPRDAHAYRDILASNAEELERLGRMVADMLFLAKTERGVDLPRKERFSASIEARALLDFYEAVAQEQRVQCLLQGEGFIVGDRLMFRRALSNLLSNALRHSPAGSTVHIDVTETPQATTVQVSNAGPPIAPDVLPRLFDRFYRADPARPHAEGTGLGLSITKAIIEAHGGHVRVESNPQCTRFSLEFPQKTNHQNAA